MSDPPDVKGESRPDGADGALDGLDMAILAALRDIYGSADPPPPDLDLRVLFAIALDDVNVEIARLQQETLVGSGPRGVRRTRNLTFDSGGLTIMVSLAEIASNRVRIDGWLAPPAPRRVELRLAGGPAGTVGTTRATVANATGRFVFGGVRRGLAQLRVHPIGPDAPSVVTPSIVL
jgi:hypothetical protein